MDNRCTEPCASVRRERRWALRRRRRGSLNRGWTNAVLTGQSGNCYFVNLPFPGAFATRSASVGRVTDPRFRNPQSFTYSVACVPCLEALMRRSQTSAKKLVAGG